MADISDLGFRSLTSIPRLEGLELIKRIRLSRRIPVKKVKRKTSPKKTVKQVTKSLTKSNAKNLLSQLGGIYE